MNLERTLTSLEVAEMVGREHYEVLKDIRRIVEQLGAGTFPVGSYFIESAYKDSNNQSRPCYNLTKKGCELYGTRMTGEKGTLFAVKYIEKFNEMEQEQQRPMSQLEIMQLQVEQLIKQDKQLKELESKQIVLETKIDNFHDVIKTNSDNWRTETSILIKRIANNMGGTHMIREVHNRVYESLESRGKCNLDIRLSNFKKRCEHLGVPASKVNAKNKLDVIAEDPKLVEIYVAIVKEFAVKGGF